MEDVWINKVHSDAFVELAGFLVWHHGKRVALWEAEGRERHLGGGT